MNFWQIGLIAWFALNAVLTVAMIGKERKPSTPGAAVVSLFIFAALVYVAVRA